MDGRIQMTTAERYPVPPTDQFYLDWENPASIVMLVSSVVFGLMVLAMAVFIFLNWSNPVVQDTSLSFHLVQFGSMFISCFIPFVYVGDPANSTCAFRPWTSLCFTFVYGNILARQLAVGEGVLTTLLKTYRDQDDDIGHILNVKYGPFLLARNLSLFVAVHILILAVWTAVAPPTNTLITSPGPWDTEVINLR